MLTETFIFLFFFEDLRLSQVSSYYRKLKEYSEQLEWIPASSSNIEHLLHEQFDRCLTADCLNEIENTMHEVKLLYIILYYGKFV